jgi:hypothetical protein
MNDEELLEEIHQSAKRARAAEAAVRPLGELERARIARSLAASLPGAQARARKRTFYARVGVAGGALALAAAMLLVVRRPPAIDDLPSYEMALSGGAREYRGEVTPEAKGPLRMRKGDRFEAILRPPRTSAGAIAARALLLRRGAAASDPAGSIPFRGTPDVAPGGTVRVSGTLDDFPGVTPGEWELIVVVGRPDAIGGAPPALEAGPGRQVQRARVIVE